MPSTPPQARRYGTMRDQSRTSSPPQHWRAAAYMWTSVMEPSGHWTQPTGRSSGVSIILAVLIPRQPSPEDDFIFQFITTDYLLSTLTPGLNFGWRRCLDRNGRRRL